MSIKVIYSACFAVMLMLFLLASPALSATREGVYTDPAFDPIFGCEVITPDPIELGTETKPLSQVDAYLETKPPQKLGQYTIEKKLRQTWTYGRDEPAKELVGDKKPLYDVQEQTRDMPLTDLETETKGLKELAGEPKPIYDLEMETGANPLYEMRPVYEIDQTPETKEVREIPSMAKPLYTIPSKVRCL